MSDQDERATYDVTATQDKWRKVWDELDHAGVCQRPFRNLLAIRSRER